MNTSDIPFAMNTAAVINVNYPDIQKDTTTYITISNDVLFFTISRLTICRNSVVKYKYQPSKSLENALFSAFYLSSDFIVGILRVYLLLPLICPYYCLFATFLLHHKSHKFLLFLISWCKNGVKTGVVV